MNYSNIDSIPQKMKPADISIFHKNADEKRKLKLMKESLKQNKSTKWFKNNRYGYIEKLITSKIPNWSVRLTIKNL